MELIKSKRYKQHLEADEVKGTKEYEVKQLMDILGLIAKVLSKIENKINECIYFHGKTDDGKVFCKPEEKLYIDNMAYLYRRLKTYYNNKVSKLQKF